MAFIYKRQYIFPRYSHEACGKGRGQCGGDEDWDEGAGEQTRSPPPPSELPEFPTRLGGDGRLHGVDARLEQDAAVFNRSCCMSALHSLRMASRSRFRTFQFTGNLPPSQSPSVDA